MLEGTWSQHIGSFANFVGASTNEVVRLFEFEKLSHWEKFMEDRDKMFESEEGRKLLKKLSRFITSLEEKVLISAY